MIVRVLGSAAGGGVPQWNCVCDNCMAVRRGKQKPRTQSSFAISADGKRWTLVNCSPDVTRQIEAYPPLHPQPQGTPLNGVLLTDANVDHIGGLAELRQAGNHQFTIVSSEVVREIALREVAFRKYAEPPHRWIVPDESGNIPRGAFDFDVRAIDVPGLTPGYDGRRQVPGAVTAYEVKAAIIGVVFAPVYAGITDGLRAAVEQCNVSFLDGTFFRDDEMEGLGRGDKRATELGHLPLAGIGGTVAQFAGIPTRRILSHVNNTNPILDPSSIEGRSVREAGFDVAFDGLELRY